MIFWNGLQVAPQAVHFFLVNALGRGEQLLGILEVRFAKWVEINGSAVSSEYPSGACMIEMDMRDEHMFYVFDGITKFCKPLPKSPNR